MSFAMVSPMHLMALSIMSESFDVRTLIILGRVYVMLLSIFSSEIVNMVKKQGEHYRRTG